MNVARCVSHLVLHLTYYIKQFGSSLIQLERGVHQK
jgi:hypothetical protein